MRRWSSSALAACLVATLAFMAPAGASPIPCEPLDGDTTWTKAEGPHVIPATGICVFGSLMIEAGAEVVSEGGGFEVWGDLVAVGSEAEPVTFSGMSGAPWAGITVRTPGDQPPSELRHVAIRHAERALLLRGRTPLLEALTFDANEKALVLSNPAGPVDLTGSVFTSNGKAVAGKSRDDVTITSTDFWNNRVNLAARPQGAWDCGDDDMTWSVTGNDFLRGPVNDEYWSFDVRTPPGSRVSPYVVDVSDNWWGAPDETTFRTRTTKNWDCCPGKQRKSLVWKPLAIEPQTAWEPPGPVIDPEPEPSIHGDPPWYPTITRPRHSRCVGPSFRRVAGRGVAALSEPPDSMLIALRKTGGARCLWWNHRKQRFVARGCGHHLWFRISGEEWSYRFSKALRPGRYTLIAGGRHSYRIPALDLVKFRVAK